MTSTELIGSKYINGTIDCMVLGRKFSRIVGFGAQAIGVQGPHEIAPCFFKAPRTSDVMTTCPTVYESQLIASAPTCDAPFFPAAKVSASASKVFEDLFYYPLVSLSRRDSAQC